jgi:hypothetical protein
MSDKPPPSPITLYKAQLLVEEAKSAAKNNKKANPSSSAKPKKTVK